MSRRWAALSLSLVALSLMPVRAQQQGQSDVDGLLARAYSNMQAAWSGLPDIVADEHVVSTFESEALGGGAGRQMPRSSQPQETAEKDRLVADSDFYVRHTPDGLSERREVRTSNHPVRGDQPDTGPTMVSGIFSNGFIDFDPEMARCYDFRVEPPRKTGPNLMILRYALKPGLPADNQCPVKEEMTGRVSVDPATIQVVHVEQRLPKHNVYRGQRGTWTWSIDYAEIELNDREYWLPQTITSESDASSSGAGHLRWTFTASYTNYRLAAR